MRHLGVHRISYLQLISLPRQPVETVFMNPRCFSPSGTCSNREKHLTALRESQVLRERSCAFQIRSLACFQAQDKALERVPSYTADTNPLIQSPRFSHDRENASHCRGGLHLRNKESESPQKSRRGWESSRTKWKGMPKHREQLKARWKCEFLAFLFTTKLCVCFGCGTA
jgi:hypothetical protein